MRTRILIFGLVVVFAFLHFLYLWAGGLYLYKLSGGITTGGKWTQFGGATQAWTIPIVLPGTLVMLEQEKASGLGNPDCASYGSIGFLLVFGGEIATSYALASVIANLFTGGGLAWGRLGWKAILIALGLVWMPVPESWTFVYQYTVVY